MVGYNKGLQKYQQAKLEASDKRIRESVIAYWDEVEYEVATALERLELYRKSGVSASDLQARSNRWASNLGNRLLKHSRRKK